MGRVLEKERRERREGVRECGGYEKLGRASERASKRAREREKEKEKERARGRERERECVGEGMRESREGVRKLEDWAKEKVERLCKSGEGVPESESGEGVKERVERV